MKSIVNFFVRHREMLLVIFLGLIMFSALNVMMLFYHYDAWTNPKVGFWSAFYNRFEISGFDPYTYITVSKWRPLYVISRHPLLAGMVWPLSELNEWIKEDYQINSAIFIVAVVWTILAVCSWTLMYRIMRKIVKVDFWQSLLLTAFFFSFSHILLVTFTPDHMSLTLPLVLLTIYLAGKAIEKGRTMPLWQSLPLLFVSTGVTTTNMVKIGLADLFTQWDKKSFGKIIINFLFYLIPLGGIAWLYVYQQDTTQAEETQSNNRLMQRKAAKDSTFAKELVKFEQNKKKRKSDQLIKLDIATNTEYHIDRVNSVVENIFGEGFILHEDYCLMDANRARPVLVRYNHWWYYAMEVCIVGLFIAGVWYGRRERLVWMTMSMFLFDMLLHVGLNFASADVYIMTAHWAFAIPIAVGFMLKKVADKPKASMVILSLVLFLTLFMCVHNVQLIYTHIIG